MVITGAAAHFSTVGEAADSYHAGTSKSAYALLGAHLQGDRFVFRVFAPGAELVRVCGDFNGWSNDALPMQCVTKEGIWEASLPAEDVKNGQFYKFRVVKDGADALLADPFARLMQALPDAASVICAEEDFAWSDSSWLAYRERTFERKMLPDRALNLYRLDPCAWKRHEDGTPLTYEELADELAVYAKQMGYTHVELLSVCCPTIIDGHLTGAFALTDVYGTPASFAAFVNRIHEAGVGVVIDWNLPAQMPDEPSPEQSSLLLSSAAFWCEVYHVDGLRFPCGAQTEAPARMLAEEFPDVLAIPERSEAQSYAASADTLPSLRVQLLRMMTSPGKKRLVMGREIGMLRSWREAGCVDWNLLNEDSHAQFQAFVASLNHFYLESPALWEESFEECFEVLDCGEGVIAYRRHSYDGQMLTVLINASAEEARDLSVPVPDAGEYAALIDTDGTRDTWRAAGGCIHVRLRPLSATVIAQKTTESN